MENHWEIIGKSRFRRLPPTAPAASGARMPERKMPIQRSQAKSPKLKFPSESVQAEVSKGKLPS